MSQACSPPQGHHQDTVTRAAPATASGSALRLPPSVVGEVLTPAGSVPAVSTDLKWRDNLGRWKVRWGIGRMRYTLAPGLYAVGHPDQGSEVLVTANYLLTFDILRSSLANLNVWIMVLDTSGINVWCAAGKGTFGTEELVRRVESTRLGSVVSHRRLILPQLGAPGVAAHEVKAKTGFKVVYGPVEARDIPAYLGNGRQATPDMRRKKFPLAERVAVVPVELIPASKWVIGLSLTIGLLSGLLGEGTFSGDALRYGSRAFLSLVLGTAAGAVAAPVLLPWIPGRAFSIKGALTGAAAAMVIPFVFYARGVELVSWTLITISLSSFLAMNFTGSSTFTSLSGVKKEMKEAVPFQVTAGSLGLVMWLVALFTRGGAV